MFIFEQTRGQSLGYKGTAGDNGLISTSTAEVSPLAYSLTTDNEQRQFIWWLEAFYEGGKVWYGYELRLYMDAAPGFESPSDRTPPQLLVNGAAAFKHDGQLKAQLLHFRGAVRPNGPNDNTRDQYTYRSGIYLVDHPEL